MTELSAFLEVKNLSKSFQKEKPVLNNVSLSAEPGEVIGIIGENGSGKTTLFNIISGKIVDYDGKVSVNKLVPNRDVLKFRQTISYVPQDVTLDPELSAWETFSLFWDLELLPKNEKRKSLDELVELFKLTPHLHKRVSRFSGGLKRRLHLALGFIKNSPILILDEPTSNLDANSRSGVWKMILRRAKRDLVLIVSHDFSEIEHHCSRVVFLHQGKILQDGAPRQITKGLAKPMYRIQAHHKQELVNLKKTMEDELGSSAYFYLHDGEIMGFPMNHASTLELETWFNKNEEATSLVGRAPPSLETAYFRSLFSGDFH